MEDLKVMVALLKIYNCIVVFPDVSYMRTTSQKQLFDVYIINHWMFVHRRIAVMVNSKNITAWKVSVFGVFMVHISLCIQSECGKMREKCGPE